MDVIDCYLDVGEKKLLLVLEAPRRRLLLVRGVNHLRSCLRYAGEVAGAMTRLAASPRPPVRMPRWGMRCTEYSTRNRSRWGGPVRLLDFRV